MAIEARPRRQAIEDVASTLFHERGYAATSVRDIARALDIRGASLYAHVASKEEVLWAIVDRAAGAFERAADEALAATSGSGAGKRLAELVRAHVRVITADPELASVFVHEWRHLAEPRREAILRRRDAYEAHFRNLIAEGRRAGEFDAVDSRLASTFILTALNGIATWYGPAGRVSAVELANRYADLALRSVGGIARTETSR